jgi:hypothetical protein
LNAVKHRERLAEEFDAAAHHFNFRGSLCATGQRVLPPLPYACFRPHFCSLATMLNSISEILSNSS